MSDTTHLGLPLVAAAQAQKHVTVNEALAALDALVQLSVLSATVSLPPGSPAEGARYLVPAGASGIWAGRTGQIASYTGGAWTYHLPGAGWRCSVADEGALYWHDGTAWRAGPERSFAAVTSGGAATEVAIATQSATLASGMSVTVPAAIPDRAIVLGVTARVTTAISGASSWDLGVVADTQRYGNGIGTALDSTVNGVSGTPVAYYGATDLVVSAQGSAFSGGAVSLAVHFLRLTPPL